MIFEPTPTRSDIPVRQPHKLDAAERWMASQSATWREENRARRLVNIEQDLSAVLRSDLAFGALVERTAHNMIDALQLPPIDAKSVHDNIMAMLERTTQQGSRRPTYQQMLDVHERDGGRCQACGSTFQLQYDHIIPWSKGGPTTVGNLQLLCGPCNRHKSDN
jgi:HNH endonuclease